MSHSPRPFLPGRRHGLRHDRRRFLPGSHVDSRLSESCMKDAQPSDDQSDGRNGHRLPLQARVRGSWDHKSTRSPILSIGIWTATGYPGIQSAVPALADDRRNRRSQGKCDREALSARPMKGPAL
ncbi:uncharacterized protein BDZ99DRAFT_494339 [Mytilinidion resinicola]|uniref:Uncharacterized protein n=1 Tax=Mytilinidion resinicola TaxID=574789 RepID=A0A6A6Z8J7_9PEZI|nr:uncharacterized protein BDZ99DRAFT_494339 [Mytilinidion resinicola]KAF2816527.1 hypothetical protein BDZ99DRAFT_494339 [Mytilinidion resinicola]